ncbi:hypothetical protein HNQ51_002373 [Inhella inkyongensis]|uniref:Uncharacterized protein n=1 Tax=Inhella inkyongensis TaxID=392593 RepID=A0A840S8D2_9BURK|nr:hypothetical protein [Inhella inkyongensis]MBB5205054.1 hypothetical protein [Inhella inkyongensis]
MNIGEKLALTLALASSGAQAAVSVQYYNRDSVTYVWEAMCGGSRYTVEFRQNTSATTTIPGPGPCIVKTPKGEVRLGQGAEIQIKDGAIVFK